MTLHPVVHFLHIDVFHVFSVFGGFGHVDRGMRLMGLVCTYSIERGVAGK